MKTAVQPAASSQLVIKKSGLPGAGKGLFTRRAIKKGSRITEYIGKVTTWKIIKDNEQFNGYVYYITRNHVIDALSYITTFGRYANDARGINRVTGVSNNAEYTIEGKKVYIQAMKDIPAGDEILVSYGKEYWDVIKYNAKLERQNTKKTSVVKKK